VLNDQSTEAHSISRGALLGISLVESSHEVFLRHKRDGGTTGEVVLNVHTHLSSVSDVSLTLDTGTANSGADFHDLRMDSTRNAVLLLDVDLGKVEVLLIIRVVFFDVSSRGSIDHVAHLETLDSLILGRHTSTAIAGDDIRMALVLLTTTVVPSLRWHF
jgi:hypothetical protein